MKQAAIASGQTLEKKWAELGSNEAMTNWSLEEDEEAALTKTVNTRKAEVINQCVAAKEAVNVEESGNYAVSASEGSGNQLEDESKDANGLPIATFSRTSYMK